jgi:uncharacterized membrane protein required for colicin V production
MPLFLKEIGWMDGLALCAVLFLVIRGFVCGCSGEIGRFVGVVTAAAAGFFGFAPLARAVLAAGLFHANPYAGRLVVFILLSVVCIALWLGLRRLLAGAIRLAIAQPFDAILGGVFGGIQAFILVAVLCAFGLLSPRESDRARFQQHSVTAQKLAPLLKRITSPDM